MTLPLCDGLFLRIPDQMTGTGPYPTRRLQRGLLLVSRADDLAEEGVGFGVPIIKRGVQTVFPGHAKLACRRDGPDWQITTAFDMDLVERLTGPDGRQVRPAALYAAKDALAALHRRSPALRSLLTATSSGLRRAFGWETTYEAAPTAGTVAVTCAGRDGEGCVSVAVQLSGLRINGVTEVVVMNEQGARHFARYQDSQGISLEGKRIGAWNEVTAGEARFVSHGDRIAFSLRQVAGARLYRGRELIGSRLAWSGFGYALPPSLQRFTYDVRIEKA
jgi:hypothetical protein